MHDGGYFKVQEIGEIEVIPSTHPTRKTLATAFTESEQDFD
jgi:hypothetical protein